MTLASLCVHHIFVYLLMWSKKLKATKLKISLPVILSPLTYLLHSFHSYKAMLSPSLFQWLSINLEYWIGSSEEKQSSTILPLHMLSFADTLKTKPLFWQSHLHVISQRCLFYSVFEQDILSALNAISPLTCIINVILKLTPNPSTIFLRSLPWWTPSSLLRI